MVLYGNDIIPGVLRGSFNAQKQGFINLKKRE